ncbi:PspC domain-containing protein [Paenibacillus sambharensis]|uniref:PspC domain-containing protein n=1 Tax=Paenibacillus sambharensis TaxID=1803190 RepID=A0A2W1L941_9BACL|nr:PspC domain-containing protein [Paenibacillus sambharensis]PZD95433.1 PspC domain-containing protein [Paenibacillus sambharensis]
MNKLYRSRTDRKLSGLCGGIAEWLKMDASFIRIIILLTTLFSFGSMLLIYIAASVITPKAPVLHMNTDFDPFNGYRYN